MLEPRRPRLADRQHRTRRRQIDPSLFVKGLGSGVWARGVGPSTGAGGGRRVVGGFGSGLCRSAGCQDVGPVTQACGVVS
jgi:hypothetical protein